MQIGRLFEIVYLLMKQETIPAKSLAERFEVSTRTIYRDIDTLSGAGIPVYANKGKGGGIRILPDFVLNKSFLSEQDQSEILFALQTLKATNAMEKSDILSRLAALFQRDYTEWIDVDFSHWGSGQEEKKKFQLLKSAILEQKLIHFTYYSANGSKSIRKAEPHKMIFKNSAWYLQAYCIDRQEFRTFKINRMDAIILDDVHFSQRRPVPVLNEAWSSNEPEQPVELWVSSHMAYRVYDDFSYEQIKKLEDGSFSIFTSLPPEEWAAIFLLSFGSDLKVVSPPNLREKLYIIGKKIADNNKPL